MIDMKKKYIQYGAAGGLVIGGIALVSLLGKETVSMPANAKVLFFTLSVFAPCSNLDISASALVNPAVLLFSTEYLVPFIFVPFFCDGNTLFFYIAELSAFFMSIIKVYE